MALAPDLAAVLPLDLAPALALAFAAAFALAFAPLAAFENLHMSIALSKNLLKPHSYAASIFSAPSKIPSMFKTFI